MQVKKRMYITIGLLGALTLGLLGGVAIPAVLSARDLEKKIAEEQDEIDRSYALRRHFRKSVANLIETKRRMGAVSTVALQDGKELDFIQALETEAAASGVEQKITLETVNQKDVSTWEREIPLKLEIEGVYTDVLRHLNGVERLPYYVLVDSIWIVRPQANGKLSKEGAVKASVAATVYWQSRNAPDFVRGVNETSALPTD